MNPDINTKIRFILEIARGMYHLHTAISGRQIIHRDLAARNILLKKGSCLVADFGMARMKEQNEAAGKTRQEFGPLKWMAPESFKEGHYSTKSDVFSFAVTVYEILAQTEPWP